MFVLIEKNTGKLLESQSLGNYQLLLNNAINAGFSEEEIEIKEVSETEFQQILDSQPKTKQRTQEDYLLDIDFRLSLIELGIS